MTYLQAVNHVLRRLREDTVATYDSTDYSTLIGDFVNDTIQQMQNAWEWNALLENITLTMDGSDEYDITGSSEMTRVIQVYHDTNDWIMYRKSYEWITKQKLFTTTTGDTVYFRETGTSASGERQIEFYPTPTSGHSIVVSCYNPHGLITTDATVLKVPTQPVIYGSWYRAIEERGEDGGGQSTSILNQYRRTLQDAIILDSERKARHELDWNPV